MRFDIDRLSRLAGIADSKESLNEASNRSSHDDKSVADEVAWRWGKNQLSEADDAEEEEDLKELQELMDEPELEEWGGRAGDVHGADGGEAWGDQPGDEDFTNEREDLMAYEDDEDDEGVAGMVGELDDVEWMGEQDDLEPDSAEDLEEDSLLEIDEEMIREELLRMRSEKLQENKLRGAIRNEIQSIFHDLGVDEDHSWVYGDNKPANSRKGSVIQGFPGIGFM